MLMALILPSKDTTHLIKKEDLTYLLPKRNPYHRQKQALVEGERLEEDLPSQWPPKTGRGSNTHLGQNRLQTYNDQMR
jgi:hypothetical protein